MARSMFHDSLTKRKSTALLGLGFLQINACAGERPTFANRVIPEHTNLSDSGVGDAATTEPQPSGSESDASDGSSAPPTGSVSEAGPGAPDATETCTGSDVPAVDSCAVEGNDDNCNGVPNEDCECIAGQTTTCAEVYLALGVCAAIELQCSEAGRWPSASACEATSAETCEGDVDEDCDGEINEVADCPCAAEPCENGGLCEPGVSDDGSGYTCDCGNTAYAGRHCEQPRVEVLPLGPGGSDCVAVAMSQDGSVVGATCNSRPAYWTASSGWQYLVLPNGYTSGTLSDLSADGEVFVATLESNAGGMWKAARWQGRNSTGTILAGGTDDTYAEAISGNGLVTVGNDASGALLVWNEMQSAIAYSQPQDVSATLYSVTFDGSTVWGSGAGEMVSWTAPHTFSVFEVPDVSTITLTDVSDDGRVAVGVGWTTSGAGAGRLVDGQWSWLNASGAGVCFAYGTNAEGSRVAGWCNTPVVWFGNDQFDVVGYLELAAAGLDVDVTEPTSRIVALSADGTVALGDAQARAFIVRLPP